MCKGAVWAAISVMRNTDLCDNGVPIYFHVEDLIWDKALEVFDACKVPRDWLIKTQFKDPELDIAHPIYGKKMGCFIDEFSLDTDMTLLLDSDAFVCRDVADKKLELYERFETDLADKILVSFYSNDNGGDLSYVNWLRYAAGMDKLEGEVPEGTLSQREQDVYDCLGLSHTTLQNRYGAIFFSVPRASGLFDFLGQNCWNAYADEGLVSAWINSTNAGVVNSYGLGLPVCMSAQEFMTTHNSCIAHLYTDNTTVDQYYAKFKRGIARDDSLKLNITNRSRKRFHVISVPHTPSSKKYTCCAFGQKARKLCYMLDYKGHEVYHYGNELSEVQATEHISVTSEAVLREVYGDIDDQNYIYKFNEKDHVYKTFFLNTEHELRKRVQKDDILCYVFAPYQKPLYEALQDLPVHHVESGIGYYYPYMPYKVFESAAVRDFNMGIFQRNYDYYASYTEEQRNSIDINMNETIHHSQPQWQDGIIPNSFDVEDFEFSTEKEDYFLYLGRIMKGKGVEEAMRIAHACGVPLKVAGPHDFVDAMGFEPWDNVELLGPVGVEERRELMAKAKLGFCISHYPEPFGGVHIEYALSGTPTIGSNFGVYTTTLKHGTTGYRITNYEQGVWAAKNIDRIDPHVCREHGLKFSNERVAEKYDEYFDCLLRYVRNDNSIYWAEYNERQDLDWIDE